MAEAEKYYLLAIEKGDVDALNNLGNLYSKQQKLKDAEKYYLLAIEKENTNAFLNLSIDYYDNNTNKQKALDYIQAYSSKMGDRKRFQTIIEVWYGILDDIYEKIDTVFKQIDYLDADYFLIRLLIHDQLKIVLRLFTDSIHAAELQKRFVPLYYAVLLLNNKTDNNLSLRIPPEILPTVNDIIKEVREGQEFYSS